MTDKPEMRYLGAIIEDCLVGRIPTVDELRYAVCALNMMIGSGDAALGRLAEIEQGAEASCDRDETATGVHQQHGAYLNWASSIPPNEFLGDKLNPDDPAVQLRHQQKLAALRGQLN